MEKDIAVSHVSVVEVLGYQRFKPVERQYLEQFFASVRTLPVSEAVVSKAVAIRQAKPMPLADAVIAVTALVHGLALLTENIKDYAHIKDLVVLTIEDLTSRP